MIEIWKSIKGFEGYYEISNMGNVRSIARTILVNDKIHRNIKSKILKLSLNENGYVILNVRVNNVPFNLKIHRLVAKAFIPNPDNKPTVNHIDGNKLNNFVSNLEWASYSENIKHAYNNGLNNSKSQYKPIIQYSMDNDYLQEFDSISEAKRILKISGGHIGEACSGKIKSAYGYIWKYK